MIGAEAIVGWIDENHDVNLKAYILRAKNVSAIVADPRITLESKSGCSADGYTSFEYTRKLDQGTIKFNLGGKTKIILAYGDKKELSIHNYKYSGEIDVSKGFAIPFASIHAILTVTSLILMNFGSIYMLLSRTKEVFYNRKRQMHNVLQILSMLLLIPGFVIAIYMKTGNHFSSSNLHGQSGLITVICTLIQFIIGIIVHFKYNSDDNILVVISKILHRWLGIGIICLSLLTITLGLSTVYENYYNFWFGILFGVSVSILILAIFIGVSRLLCVNHEEMYTQLEPSYVT